MVIQQNRYIQAAQQLIRLWSGARGQRSGPLESIRPGLEAVAEQVGVDLALAQRLTPESLELLVSPSGSPDSLRSWLLAELLYVSARLAEREADVVQAREADRRALHLYERVEAGDAAALELPDPESRIAELRARWS
jgi:hypothetical protein